MHEQRLKFNATSLQALVKYLARKTIVSGFGALVYEPNDVCAAFLVLNLDLVRS